MVNKLIIFVFLLNSLYASSQVGIRAFYFEPRGEIAVTANPTFSGEISYIGSFEYSRTRMRFGLSFIHLTPRLSSFPVYGVLGGNNVTVIPGSQTFSRMDMAFISSGFDFAFLDKDPLYIYGGFSLLLGGVAIDYTAKYQTIMDESYSGGDILGGYAIRLGVAYNISDLVQMFVESENKGYFVDNTGLFMHNEYSFGVRLNFSR